MVNQCIFIGRLGKDPEVRATQSGVSVCNFSIACSERWKDKDGNQQEKTEWINIVAWKRLAEICGEYLHKGDLVFVSGSFQTRKWQDQSGNDRYTAEIVAKEIRMLSAKNRGTDRENQNYSPQTGDDLPF